MGLFNHGAGDDGAVLQHVLQVYQVAIVHVLGVIVRVVEVDDAGLMGLHDFFGQQNPPGDVFRDLASHVIPLNGIHRGVFIGVFLLDFLVVAFDEGENPVIGGVGLPDEAPGVAVSDVLFGHLKGTVGHNGLFYQILNFLDGGAAAHFLAAEGHAFSNPVNLGGSHLKLLCHGGIGPGDGGFDFGNVKGGLCTVAFDDLHRGFSSLLYLWGRFPYAMPGRVRPIGSGG